MINQPRNNDQTILSDLFSRREALARFAGVGAATAITFGGLQNVSREATAASKPVNLVSNVATSAGSEILWDTWGVPHVYAGDAASLFHGFGWAQAHNHGDLLLRMYALARGRGAEFFGEEMVLWDRLSRTMGTPDQGAIWFAAQSSEFQANLTAFAEGINDYASGHGDRLSEAAKAVLPVEATDVLAHVARIFSLFLGISSDVIGAEVAGAMAGAGSNGWAIGPSYTASGNAMLLANPHLTWGEEQTFFEAHLQAPGVYDAYGAALVGFPVLMIAFNDSLGWTHTSNTIDAADLYILTPDGAGYEFDGETRAFDTRDEVIKILQEDGVLREAPLTVRRSVHGPVVEIEGNLIAIRQTAVDQWSSAAGMVEQWWDMARATDFAEFETILRRLQIPYFNVISAGNDGHIQMLFNGQVPIRPEGEFDWSGPVPGDSSATLWTEIHGYDDLPKVTDPVSGWVQNSNSPPWYAANPLALDPASYPSYMAPEFLHWRERRGIRVLEENPGLTLERMIELQQSTRMELADHVLEELISVAIQSDDPTAARAAEVLSDWDREATASSTGTLLFTFWVQGMEAADHERLSDLFVTPWDPADPLTMPSGLADPDKAVQSLIGAANKIDGLFGRLDVARGDVARMRRGSVDVPANGVVGEPYGSLRVLDFDYSAIAETKQISAIFGDSFVAAVEFGDTARAQVLMTYGNASQTDSPHYGDQLVLSAKGEMRTPWRSRAEIEANLEEYEILA